MSTAIEYPHIIKREGDVAHLERAPRFKLSLFIEVARGMDFSVERLHESYPFLSPSDIYAALTYYHDHRAEIDAEIEERERVTEEFIAAHPQTGLKEKLIERLRQISPDLARQYENAEP